MNRLLCVVALIVSALSFALNAQQKDFFVNGGNYSNAQTIETAPPPVVINGKRVEDLSDDETIEFLQKKVSTVYQSYDSYELIRVAPGYPVVLSFKDPPIDYEAGDSAMFIIRKRDNCLILRAHKAQGDMPLYVFFAGGKKRVFHCTIVPDFSNGQSVVNVEGSRDSRPALRMETPGGLSTRLPNILRVVRNYDAYIQEKVVSEKDVRRVPAHQAVNTVNPSGFVHYYTYIFSDGVVVMTFSWANKYSFPVRLDESRMRVAIGNMLFVPELVGLSKTVVDINGSSSGYLVFYDPSFDVGQKNLRFEWN